ncbi:hypothetical protein [Pseudomonas fluorescens]|uniref:Uncharacterized protein n=1 Tax=Pseudomonas fluorescens TaxID=294 RepID=A0A5E7CXX6_PSEFL|nr:hypothetical protein [Pseudomonas fluorescens]VVO10140.1 hypothetical protein PS723_03349 [Pseudomonas fluorescens]
MWGSWSAYDSFIEKALLLIIAAILSSIIAPVIVKSIDSSREGKEALSLAQAKLFNEASETVLNCQTLMLDVTWFGTADAKNAEMQKKAFERYSERSVDLLSKWRALANQSYVLASEQTSTRLNTFLNRFFAEQDAPMNRQWIKCGTECDWSELHKTNNAMLIEANELISDLANELHLTRN